MKDTDLLAFIEDELVDLRCVETANADAGDYSVHWEVVQHYTGGKEKVIGVGATAREAIFDASLEPGDIRRSDYVPPEYKQRLECI